MHFGKIETQIWTDPDFESLSKESKLLWLYLITNPRNNYAGIYKITKHRMLIDTKINDIDNILSELTDTLPIAYYEDENIVWVKNFLKKLNPNEKQLKGITKYLQKVKNKSIIEDYLKYNDTLCIPYQPKNDTLWVDKDIDIDIDNSSIVEESKDSQLPKKLLNELEKQKIIDRDISKYLMEFIIERNPDYKELSKQEKCNYVKWGKHVRLMREQDKRKPEEIYKIIKWCQEDEFWQDNILSTQKLRQQYDQLKLKMQKDSNYWREQQQPQPYKHKEIPEDELVDPQKLKEEFSKMNKLRRK